MFLCAADRPSQGDRAGLGEPLAREQQRRLARRLDLFPHRTAAQSDAQALRLHGGDFVPAGQPERFRNQDEIIDGPAVPAHRVQRAGGHFEPLATHRAPGRLQAINAVERGRADMRAAGLRAECEWDMKIAHRGARPGGRAARRVRGIIRIARQRLSAAGREFNRVGLAENERAVMPCDGNRRRVAPDLHARVDRRILGGRHVRRVEHVLYAPREAMQHAFRRQLVQFARVANGLLGIEIQPGPHRRVARADAREAGAHQFLARQLFGGHQGRGFGCGKLARLGRGAGGRQFDRGKWHVHFGVS